MGSFNHESAEMNMKIFNQRQEFKRVSAPTIFALSPLKAAILSL
jgi:hypothetical protein